MVDIGTSPQNALPSRTHPLTREQCINIFLLSIKSLVNVTTLMWPFLTTNDKDKTKEYIELSLASIATLWAIYQRAKVLLLDDTILDYIVDRIEKAPKDNSKNRIHSLSFPPQENATLKDLHTSATPSNATSPPHIIDIENPNNPTNSLTQTPSLIKARADLQNLHAPLLPSTTHKHNVKASTIPALFSTASCLFNHWSVKGINVFVYFASSVLSLRMSAKNFITSYKKHPYYFLPFIAFMAFVNGTIYYKNRIKGSIRGIDQLGTWWEEHKKIKDRVFFVLLSLSITATYSFFSIFSAKEINKELHKQASHWGFKYAKISSAIPTIALTLPATILLTLASNGPLFDFIGNTDIRQKILKKIFLHPCQNFLLFIMKICDLFSNGIMLYYAAQANNRSDNQVYYDIFTTAFCITPTLITGAFWDAEKVFCDAKINKIERHFQGRYEIYKGLTGYFFRDKNDTTQPAKPLNRDFVNNLSSHSPSTISG